MIGAETIRQSRAFARTPFTDHRPPRLAAMRALLFKHVGLVFCLIMAAILFAQVTHYRYVIATPDSPRLAFRADAESLRIGRRTAGAWLLSLTVLQGLACAVGCLIVWRHMRRSRAAEEASRLSEVAAREAEAAAMAAEAASLQAEAAARQAETQARDAEAQAREAEAVARQAEAAARYAEVASLRAQQDIRLSEERFRAAFDHAPIGVALVSPEGRWLRVNGALCDILGYSEAELLEMDFQSLTHPEDLENDLDHVRRALRGE